VVEGAVTAVTDFGNPIVEVKRRACPALAVGFSMTRTTNDSSVLFDALVDLKDDPIEFLRLLVDRKDEINAAFFSDSENDWSQFRRDDLIAFRAVGTPSVFTEALKLQFLSKVARNTELAEAANDVFVTSNERFLGNLTGLERKSAKGLMSFVYG
jgi:hypothetical protein